MAAIREIPILSSNGQVAKQFTLPESVATAKVSTALVHEVVVGLASNRRAGSAHTKNRAEVSGGGKKPWKQKGTGRARQGSIRSPQWVGGGIAHGPRNTRNWQERITDATRRKARGMVVADYLTSGRVTVVEMFPKAEKTKVYADMFKGLKLGGRRLVLLTQAEAPVRRGLKNLNSVTVAPLRELNAYEGLQHPRWVVSEAGLAELVKLV